MDLNAPEISKSFKRQKLKRIFGVFSVIACVYLAVSFLIARSLVFPARETLPKPTEFTASKLQDGTTVWIAKEFMKSPQAVFVFVHGLGGSMNHWVDAMKKLAEKNFPSITPAMPGHDDSPYAAVGFGSKESQVVLACTKWSKQKWPSAKIILVGVSLGGAACWLAVNDYPSCADAVVTESAFAHLDDAIRGWFSSRLGSIGPTVFAPTRFFATRLAGVDAAQINPVVGAQKWRGRPCIVLHDENDKLIARTSGIKLASAAGVKLDLLKGANHAQGIKENQTEFVQSLEQLGISIAKKTASR